MPAKKSAAPKRARSPENDSSVGPAATTNGLPVTWAHTPASEKSWGKHESLLHLDLHSNNDHIKKVEAANKKVKIASFDMDDTLVMSKSGKVFAEGRSDWTFIHPSVPAKLQQLHLDGYRLVIFTNQSGIGGKKGWDESKASAIRGKIIDIGNHLSVPLSAWIATGEDKYRKPQLGMWEHFASTLPFPVDMAGSFYCGDAAGRTIMTLANRKKDFSCSDRKFAINLKLPFFTPEEYFAGHKEDPNGTIHWDGMSAAELAAIPKTYPKSSYLPAAKGLECVMMVGYPGSGKSTFFKRFFASHGYAWINRDTYKDMAKCVAAASAALSSGQSVVIDNTNPAPEDRKPFIELAKKNSAALRAFTMEASKEMANHMNCMRDRLGITPRVSSIAYNIFKGKFQAPTAAEGFSEIVSVPVVADFTGLPAAAEAEFYMLS